MKKAIGIISYLPDGNSICSSTIKRENRFKKLISLIRKCDQLFNLPIILIAQNYNKFEFDELASTTKNLKIVEDYTTKLGIVGARNVLRAAFLESEYDCLIMLDDDCTIAGFSGKSYLDQIDAHPGCFYEFNLSLLKLFAISKDLFKQVSFDENCNPEKGEGFEDRLFVNTLRKRFPNKKYTFVNTRLSEISISTDDPDTTWYEGQNLKDMINKTYDKINHL